LQRISSAKTSDLQPPAPTLHDYDQGKLPPSLPSIYHESPTPTCSIPAPRCSPGQSRHKSPRRSAPRAQHQTILAQAPAAPATPSARLSNSNSHGLTVGTRCQIHQLDAGTRCQQQLSAGTRCQQQLSAGISCQQQLSAGSRCHHPNDLGIRPQSTPPEQARQKNQHLQLLHPRQTPTQSTHQTRMTQAQATPPASTAPPAHIAHIRKNTRRVRFFLPHSAGPPREGVG